MRALVPFVFVAVALPARGQLNLPLDQIPPTRAIRELMMETLSDPHVQVGVRVTHAQWQLMNLRLAKATLGFGLKAAKQAFEAADGKELNLLGDSFDNTSGRALFPFLAENQIAKLRGLTLRKDPLGALETDEVAFAVGLTSAQRKALDAMRVRVMRAALNPKKPAYRAAMAGFAELIALSKRNEDAPPSDDSEAAARIGRSQKALDRMFAHFERAVRLDPDAMDAKAPAVLSLLTLNQRRRFRS